MAAVAKLQASAGVNEVSFDRDKAELSVSFDPSATGPARLASSVGELGFTVVVGSGEGEYLPGVEFSAELDVAWVSRDGEAVDIEEHLVDFGDAWIAHRIEGIVKIPSVLLPEDERGIRVERSDPRDEAVTNEDCRGREAAVKEHPA